MGGLSPFYSVRLKAFFGKKEMTLWGLLQRECKDVIFMVGDKIEPGMSRGVEKKVHESSVQAGDSAAEGKGEEGSSSEKEDSPGSLRVKGSSDGDVNEDLESRIVRKRKAAQASNPKQAPAPHDIRLRLRSASGQKAFPATKATSELPTTGVKGSFPKHLRSSSLVREPLLGSSKAPIEIPTAPSSSRVRDKTPEISVARITPAFEVSPLHATGTIKPSHQKVLWKITQSTVVGTPETTRDFLAHVVLPSHMFMNSALRPDLFDDQYSMSLCEGFFRGAGMLQRMDELRRENEGLRGDLKTSQTVAAELRCRVTDTECRLQEEKGAGAMLEQRERAWARERETLVEEKEDLAAELKRQKELDSVSQKDLDAMYDEWGMASDDNKKLAKESYWLITEGSGSFLTLVAQSEELKSSLEKIYRAYRDIGLGRKETPLYNSKAKKQLSKLDREFGEKTPALLEKILEHPLMSIEELKVLLTPAGPSLPKSVSGDASR
ncbi:hypothetical protein Hanom_Chr09g00822061 [Helianthus anomalus]